jgi:hypothetical protein
MAAPRKPPPAWWLLGYLAQYQRRALLDALAKAGLTSDDVYLAARQAADRLSAVPYRKLSKSWAVRQHRARGPREITEDKVNDNTSL